MIQEHPTSKLGSYRYLLPGPHLDLVIASIGAGNTAARIWEVGNAERMLLLWDQGNNVLYLAGHAAQPDAVGELTQLVAEIIRPQASRIGRTFFKIQMLVRDLEATQTFCEQWSGLDLKRIATLFLQFQQSRPVALPRIDQLQLVPIDRRLFETSPAVNMELIREEIAWMWPSEMRFLSHGFGVAALAGDDIICWCTAEYLSARQCGVGITTDPAYEGQGVATATAARFVEECARRGILPCWECARDNVGSRRVAEKVGFGLISEEEYFGGSFIAQRPS